jgi:Fe-S cluster assembly protein SufD
VTPTPESLLAGDAGLPSVPAFAAALRRRGREAFAGEGLPTARLEDWRFTSLAPLAAHAFRRGGAEAGAGRAEIERLAGPPAGPRLVFVNGRLRPDLSDPGAPSAGVRVEGLARALAERPELVEPHLGRLQPAAGMPLAAWNAAFLEDGALVHLEPGAAPGGAIELVFATVARGEGAFAHPRVLVVGGRGSEATVVETHLALGDGPALTSAVTEIALDEGARLDHYQVQDQPPAAFHFSAVAASQGPGARLSTHATALGAALSRSDVRIALEGEGAEAEVTGLYLADGERVVDNHSVVEHRARSGRSREVFKGILDGASRGVWAGRIRVLEGAMKTDAHQMSSSLLLSRDAVADALPQLEIYADDVRCGHGGTVGQLDADALFYLRSRGVPRERARALLIYAFAREMVELVGPPGLRARLGERVAARLPDGSALREAA